MIAHGVTIQNHNEKAAQPIENEILQAYEDYLRLIEKDAVIIHFEAIAYDGTIACATATYQLPQIEYTSVPTPNSTLPPTQIWYREEYTVVVFTKQETNWMVEKQYSTGCSICNGGGWGPNPYALCPASITKPFS
jgi:hypothetical protein